tara:strand:- start:956 stop:1156 length:201 start_codon:yes stop_codon:yes gene_type:complete
MSNNCPYVIYLMESTILLSKEMKSNGIKTIAISSNNVDKQSQGGPEEMKKLALSKSFLFPYLLDAI